MGELKLKQAVPLARDLAFDEPGPTCSIHNAHPFPAKLPAALVRWAVEEFSRPGDTVLDPMAGCGTTLVECRLLGRNAIGVEIDPVARLIAAAKCAPVDAVRFKRTVERLRLWLDSQANRAAFDPGAHSGRVQFRWPEFPNRDYWFRYDVMRELCLLKSRLARATGDPCVRRLLWVALSSLITNDKNSVGNMRDVAHSRAHFREHKRKPNVFGRMNSKLGRLVRMVEEFVGAADPDAFAHIMGGDARSLPLRDASVELVCTSPPYLDAIDYTRALKFSAFWLGDVLHVSPSAYLSSGKRGIGVHGSVHKDAAKTNVSCSWDELLAKISHKHKSKHRRASQYVADMFEVSSEIARVLKPGGTAVLVIGRPTAAGVTLPTDSLLVELGRRAGLVCMGVETRPIDGRRRRLPICGSGLEQRMREEYVVVLQKPVRSRPRIGGAAR